MVTTLSTSVRGHFATLLTASTTPGERPQSPLIFIPGTGQDSKDRKHQNTMARLSRAPPPSSRTRKTILSSSSESGSDNGSNSDSDSEFPDIAALSPSPKRKTATRKRAFPPTYTASTTSNQGQTVVESATSPNAASSSVTGGAKRRKLFLGATFSDNVLFQKWTPTEEDAGLPARRKKKRVLTTANNNPFGLGRLALGMRNEEGGEANDSEFENPVVRRRENMKVKEVKRVGQGESTSTVIAKAEVGRMTGEGLFGDRFSVSKEHGEAKDKKMAKDKVKEEKEENEENEEKPSASLVQLTEQVTSKNNNIMEIDEEDRDLDIFEDLEDYAEASFHTACSMETSESEDGRTLKTTAARKGQNANTAAAASNSKEDDSDEDLDDFFTRLSSKPKIPIVRESHLSPTKPRETKNSRGKRIDMDATLTAERQSQKSRTLFDEEEEEESVQRQRPARPTRRTVASSDEEEDTCGEEDVTQDFSCLQLESSSSSSSSEESSETETEQRRSRPPPTAATRKRTRTPSPSSPKLIPKLKPKTAAAQPPLPPPSPKKLPRIPSTPHCPSSDLFWSREFVDDWNDEHSPVKKELFPSSTTKPTSDNTTNSSSPKKSTRAPPRSPQKLAAAQARESRLLRQAFDTHKHSLASTFLSLLDTRLTSGRLSCLTASTGGIKLVWSKTLNTTAGRANWKKESITTRLPPSSKKQQEMMMNKDKDKVPPEEEKKEVKHHASIELATKVLSTPERLFNTLAHEFCHLAVFMIDGVTTRPHGAEFKCWARKVNESEFGRHRGPLGSMILEEGESKGKWEGGYAVEVTTRHGYEIEFRYVWVCDGPLASASSGQGPAGGSGVGKGGEKENGGGCGTEYKRHSKSVDPSRHRCGVCKGVLRQVKPAPRGGQGQQGGGGNTSSADGEQPGTQGGMGMGTNKIKEKAKQSEYQIFVKEQMKVVKAQKPGLAFGEVMKEVAERWKVEKARREREKETKEKKATLPTEVLGKFSTLLEEVIADEDDHDEDNSPGMFEDEPMMDVVDLTADN